jgi:hypothetical protein
MIWLAAALASVGAGWLLGHGDAAANARIAADSAPADLLGSMLGVTLGLYGRDRIRLRRTYASPALAYVGKLILFASLSGVATFVLSPVAWDFSLVHGFTAAAAAGLFVWLGNLPVRL